MVFPNVMLLWLSTNSERRMPLTESVNVACPSQILPFYSFPFCRIGLSNFLGTWVEVGLSDSFLVWNGICLVMEFV